ncbi:hypothetical protein [Agreia sp. Leaf244]|uniref:hypothetical protein n=1 Tax=Agreia sp. Leaf244 TaxID=1736305 RepID=UPI0006F361EA|nr:hypothetical protein [Agreia sp. Leaf244]
MNKNVGLTLSLGLEEALANTLNAWGSRHGLAALTWRVMPFAESPSLEGRPLDKEVDPEELTRRWAAALQMRMNSYPLRADVSTWFLDLDAWYIEISSEPLFFGE